MVLRVLPHDNSAWLAKLKTNTNGGAVSSAGDTQTEARRILMTSGRGCVQDIRTRPATTSGGVHSSSRVQNLNIIVVIRIIIIFVIIGQKILRWES